METHTEARAPVIELHGRVDEADAQVGVLINV